MTLASTMSPEQPYPDHPRVRELARRVIRIRDRFLEALISSNSQEADRLGREMGHARTELARVTQSLLNDASLVPRWEALSSDCSSTGAFACPTCGNAVREHEARCAYCGWSYVVDVP
ncbi:MAG: hypothetical protein HYS13_11580 [Planctomycetia bacterium]|nr:hypothetical protein [Planctomycetia bacterium]